MAARRHASPCEPCGRRLLQQLAISAGILISYVLDFAFDSAGWGWRPMFAAAVLPAAALAIGMVFMSHSPRWLAMQGRWEEADKVVGRVNPQHQKQELELLHRNVEESAGTTIAFVDVVGRLACVPYVRLAHASAGRGDINTILVLKAGPAPAVDENGRRPAPAG